jgi:uncharacterized protein YukE
MDDSYLNVNFGNMQTALSEFNAHHTAASAALQDMLANLRTSLPETNWAGPGGRSAYDVVQTAANQTWENLNNIALGARDFVAQASDLWPAVDGAVTGLWG